MPNIKPYRLHRTWHLAEMLDALEDKGELVWKYSYDDVKRNAVFTIAEAGNAAQDLGTKQAEEVAQRLANKRRIVWVPVPHRGGKEQWQETIERIESMKVGSAPKPWE